MPIGRVKWFSLEKGFGFIASEEGEDVYLASSVLPSGVSTVKPGTKLEFGIVEGKRGPQALSVRIIDEPASVVSNIEDTIKILDKVGNGLRNGRHPSGPDAERLAKVLRGIAGQIEG